MTPDGRPAALPEGLNEAIICSGVYLLPSETAFLFFVELLGLDEGVKFMG